MSDVITYCLIISDDPLFSKRIKNTLTDHSISKNWRTLVFSNNSDNLHKDFKINKLFELILKIKKVNIVLIFDFESNEEICTDLVKICNKYEGAQLILQVCFFSEKHSLKMMRENLSKGAHLVEYKRPDLDDVVVNIELIRNPLFNNVPTYATSAGYDHVLWPKFLCRLNYISIEALSLETSFDELKPEEKWMKRFTPDLSNQNTLFSDSRSLDKKWLWLENMNELKYYFSDKKLINTDLINISKVTQSSENKYEYLATRSVEDSNKDKIKSEVSSTINSLKDNRIRVMVYDSQLQLFLKQNEEKKKSYNLFSYPFLSLKKQDCQDLKPHIIAIQIDRLIILDEDSNELKLDIEQKMIEFQKYIKKYLSAETVLIVFGEREENVPKISKRQLTVPYNITSNFLDQVVDIFLSKQYTATSDAEDILTRAHLTLLNITQAIGLEIPIIIEKINEHLVSFSSPMKIGNNTILELNEPCKCFLLVLEKLTEKEMYSGILMGMDEVQKMKIRMKVNEFLRKPVEVEDSLEKSKFQQLNTDVTMERLRESSEDDVDLEELKKAN